MKRILVALGGNALGNSFEEQIKLTEKTAKALLPLISEGNQLIITHGNGPQVGMINLAFENASNLPNLPFPECNAMSEGYIGYHLQNALSNELEKAGINKEVLTVITRVLVDPADEAFLNPTKPIGAFYTEAEAKKITKTHRYLMKEDAGRGFRRVVASPKPIGILEISSIRSLVETGSIVIAAGGGGIPVIKKNDRYEGIPAVIDKDYASGLLARLLKVDYFFIMTAVDKVALNYGKRDQKDLDLLKISEAEVYLKAGHFHKGSMLPKVEAAINFLKGNPNGVALIAALEKAEAALKGETGTKIII
ncbi:MAG TPA: carbamate kinase [Acholeplasmataceae bacterium]|nr:carbamate kinase [Acholeplasmataceae bacterium]